MPNTKLKILLKAFSFLILPYMKDVNGLHTNCSTRPTNCQLCIFYKIFFLFTKKQQNKVISVVFVFQKKSKETIFMFFLLKAKRTLRTIFCYFSPLRKVTQKQTEAAKRRCKIVALWTPGGSVQNSAQACFL